MTSRVLLIGEDNPLSSSPEFALYCYPPRCSGSNLRRIFGLPEDAYLGLHRKNLCDDAWSTKSARQRALELLTPHAEWSVIVLLGRKVTEVFERVVLDGASLVPFSTRKCCPGMTLVSLPHPSGRNAALWTPKARDRARQIMREVAPEIPWGSSDAEEKAA